MYDHFLLNNHLLSLFQAEKRKGKSKDVITPSHTSSHNDEEDLEMPGAGTSANTICSGAGSSASSARPLTLAKQVCGASKCLYYV